ncbi:MAG: class I SAM-dependent methyltransferase [Pseudomonadota bacterium]
MVSSATDEELKAGRGYETLFVPALFAPWARHVVEACEVGEGSHVLDVACGTGVLTRAAFERTGSSGRVVGLDAAPGMIAAAIEVEANIEWVLGSAEALPFEDGSFGCVISQFGMMFFADRAKAANEMLRVCKPGGRLALAVWHSIDQNPAYKDVVSILEEHVSPEAANAVSIPFCLGDPNALVDLFAQAGFDDVTFETKQEKAQFPSTRTMVEVELRGWLPLFDIHLSEEKISDVMAKSDEKLSKYASSSGAAEFATSAYILTACKPE